MGHTLYNIVLGFAMYGPTYFCCIFLLVYWATAVGHHKSQAIRQLLLIFYPSLKLEGLQVSSSGDSFKLQIGGLSSILQPHCSSNHGVRRSKQVSCSQFACALLGLYKSVLFNPILSLQTQNPNPKALPPEERMQIGPTLRERLRHPKMQSISVEGVDLGARGVAGGGGGKVEEKVEKTAFDIKLEKFDAASKIKVIKEVRAFTNLGLKEAKDMVEKVPVVIKQGVTKEEANEIIEKIKAVGGVAVME
ncbi:unnamed protein product [Lactuca saligna]|uniref:Large ribosomal subunit protein bL12c n=1 Tax=Lactuca saligna TaxID=75948 RepID=A0AA36E6B4_LACSI|nr:unnamed protein product [Lactuca saligna]